MSIVKVRRYGNSGVVTIPADVLRKARLNIGDPVQIEVDEAKGQLFVIRTRIESPARHDIEEIGRQVIEEH